MNFFTLFKNEERTAKIAIIVIMLALIRCLAEIFRLQSLSATVLTFENIKPFILGALSASIAVFIMILAFFFSKNRLVIIIAPIAIILLLIIKFHYMI